MDRKDKEIYFCSLFITDQLFFKGFGRFYGFGIPDFISDIFIQLFNGQPVTIETV